MRLALWSFLAATLIAPAPGCKRRCKGQTIKYIDGYGWNLCAAEARAFRGDARYLGLRLAKADRPPQRHLPAGPLVRVSESGVTVEKTRLSPWPTEDALATALRRHRGSKRPPRANLAIGPDVPVPRIASLLLALHRAGFREVSLLVTPVKPPFLPAAPDSHYRARLERFVASASPESRRKLLERRFDSVVRKSRCKPLGLVLAKTKRASAGERCKVLTGEIRKATEKCGCGFDYRGVLTVAGMLLGPYHFLGHITVPLDPSGPALTVSVHARWQHVVHRVLESKSKRFWLTPR